MQFSLVQFSILYTRIHRQILDYNQIVLQIHGSHFVDIIMFMFKFVIIDSLKKCNKYAKQAFF